MLARVWGFVFRVFLDVFDSRHIQETFAAKSDDRLGGGGERGVGASAPCSEGLARRQLGARRCTAISLRLHRMSFLVQ